MDILQSHSKYHHTGSSDHRRQGHHHGHAGSSSRHAVSAAAAAAAAPTAPTADQTHFFEHVKRALDNRQTYDEFLKTVNLFTQNYIDTATLIRQSRNFLSDGDLMRQFREILGWDERREKESWAIEQQYQMQYQQQQPGGPLPRAVLERRSRADLTVRYGSYRKLPASVRGPLPIFLLTLPKLTRPQEREVPCSGRDDMCKSVLNDEWVSHPSWSSDDAGGGGFVPHKKNAYEEALHRSEEERHEYDFHIEALVRTIAMLEPINNKIQLLAPDERGNFKLKPNLGGSAKSVHQRVIKKVYGREAGLEVVAAMQETPAMAIPVVLNRLKGKEEEWKRAQREWNRVWREVDARNYARSLDHQAVTFKAADKKAIGVKALVSQIEVAREEQVARRAGVLDRLLARARRLQQQQRQHQMAFALRDEGVVMDAVKLCFSFLDRTQVPLVERRRVEGFVRSFVQMFFVLDPVGFNLAFAESSQVQEGAVDRWRRAAVESEMSEDAESVVDEAAEASSVVSVATSTTAPLLLLLRGRGVDIGAGRAGCLLLAAGICGKSCSRASRPSRRVARRVRWRPRRLHQRRRGRRLLCPTGWTWMERRALGGRAAALGVRGGMSSFAMLRTTRCCDCSR